ncbi:MAG TPA: DUF1573 domain-containing protein [Phycisphaerales bacterium]|nr:DUF1573 domain-containing protein [Phycisphaerales bacterium]HMP38405.1 DUF1573 domain-containing protein [Phycisphaerales bacterium]
MLLDPQNVDFGMVGPDTTVSTEVGITNMTDRPIRILQSVPSCQCTSVEMAGVVLEPGSRVPMPMSMKTSKTVGTKLANVQLLLEGHPTPVEVRISCEVVYSVRASPAFIDVQQAPKDARGQVGPARPLVGTVKLESVDGKPFSVLSFHGKPPAFRGFDPDRDAPRAVYELVYDFSSIPPASVPCYQIVETDRDDCPVLDIRVRHENTHIRPAFKIADFRSSFGRVAPGAKGQFELEVKELKGVRLAAAISRDPSQALVRLVDQKADDSATLATFEVTPAPGRSGLLYFPVAITLADGRSTDLWVYGTVRE